MCFEGLVQPITTSTSPVETSQLLSEANEKSPVEAAEVFFHELPLLAR
jgi:hypothetical protein